MSTLPARRPLLIAAMACWIAFAAIAAAVAAGWTQALDEAAMLALRAPDGAAIGPAWLTRWMATATWLGDGTVRLSIAAGVAGVLLALGRRNAALFLVLAAMPAGLLNDALKGAFARPRPEIVAHLFPAGGWSFPSGHAMGAASAWLAMAYALQSVLPTDSARRAALGVALGTAALVAFTRVWLGVHYPSDVIGGVLAGTGWVLAVRCACQPLLSPAP